MKTKIVYFTAFLLLGLSSGQATPKEKILTVFERSETHWKLFIHGAPCSGIVSVRSNPDPEMPILVECK